MYLKLTLFQAFTVMSLQGFSQEGVQEGGHTSICFIFTA